MASCGCEELMFVGGNENSGSSWGNPEEERSPRLASYLRQEVMNCEPIIVDFSMALESIVAIGVPNWSSLY
eukprot:scaffold145322_cov24-Attheya_sp.AAC.1